MDGSCQFLSENRDGLCVLGLATCSALIIQYGNEAILAHVSNLRLQMDEIKSYAEELKGVHGLRITIARCLNAYNEGYEEEFEIEALRAHQYQDEEQEPGGSDDRFRKFCADDEYETEVLLMDRLMWNRNAQAQGDEQVLGDSNHDFSDFLENTGCATVAPMTEFRYRSQNEEQAFGDSDDDFREFFEDVFGITPEFLLLEHCCLVIKPNNEIDTFPEYPFQKGDDTIAYIEQNGWIKQKKRPAPTFFQANEYSSEEDSYEAPPSPSVFFLPT